MGSSKPKAKCARPTEAAATDSGPVARLMDEAASSLEQAINVQASWTLSDSLPSPGARDRGGESFVRARRVLLEDRYAGILSHHGLVGRTVVAESSRLGQRLDAVLNDVVLGVARRSDPGVRDVEAVVAELRVIIGEHVVRRLDELDLAR